MIFEEAPGTSSRLHPLQRPKFRELLTYARPGSTVHISEMFRLVRGTEHILDVLDVLHRAPVRPAHSRRRVLANAERRVCLAVALAQFAGLTQRPQVDEIRTLVFPEA